MKIAVVGSLYGQLDRIYSEVKDLEKQQGLIDLVVVCGNFQAFRNQNDLVCVAAPEEYKKLGDFPDYFSGKKRASHLTLVVAGNYEASNYFQSLPYGGWIAPNIYYMGYSGVVKFNGVRIAGISGIFNHFHSLKGRFEHLPYDDNSIKTISYTRYLEIFRMLQMKGKIDVMFTYDWPQNLPGLDEFLLKKRPLLKERIEKRQLTSPMYKLLLEKLKPKHWFAGHLPLRFQTVCVHPNEAGDAAPEKTRFLALNKCETKRKYLELISVPSDEFNVDGLEYDLEWLAILRMTNQWISNQEFPLLLPPQPWAVVEFDVESEKKKVEASFQGDFKIPRSFRPDLPFTQVDNKITLLEDVDPTRKSNFVNQQTTKLCKLLGIKDPMQNVIDLIEFKVVNPDEIDISDSDSVADWKDTLHIDPPKFNQFSNSCVYQNGTSGNRPDLFGGLLAFPELPSGFYSILNEQNGGQPREPVIENQLTTEPQGKGQMSVDQANRGD